jgi:hypothetical protein
VDFPKWDPVVEVEGDDMLIVCPILTVMLGGYRQAPFTSLTFRAFSLKCVSVITSVNV